MRSVGVTGDLAANAVVPGPARPATGVGGPHLYSRGRWRVAVDVHRETGFAGIP